MYHLKFRNEKVNSVVFFKTFRQISKVFVLFFFNDRWSSKFTEHSKFKTGKVKHSEGVLITLTVHCSL